MNLALLGRIAVASIETSSHDAGSDYAAAAQRRAAGLEELFSVSKRDLRDLVDAGLLADELIGPTKRKYRATAAGRERLEGSQRDAGDEQLAVDIDTIADIRA